MLYAQAVRVEALCNGTELGHIVIEFRNHVIPKVICSVGLPIHKEVCVVKEGLDCVVLTQELEYASRGSTCFTGVVGCQVCRCRMERE